MKHHAFTAAMGILIAAALVPATSAQAASIDPTGVWRKADEGERPGKFEIFRCGTGKKYLCAKIIWLKDPLYKGKPLHDVRNENPSMRDRPILGLPIMQGLAPSAPNEWKGNIYNPEDGNTYSVTLTVASRNQINIRGCKGWILCGTRTWLRTSPPPPEPEIEASAEPDATVQPASATPAAKPEPATETAAAEPEKPAPREKEDVFADAQMLTPAVETDAQPGYRFLNASLDKPAAGLSGENVPSMFVMNTPIESEATDTADETPAAAPAPKPAVAAPKPKPQPIEASAVPAPEPKPATVAPAPKAAAVPAEADSQSADDQSVGTADNATAETASIDESQLTWRERRQLRRQQKHMMRESMGQGLLPWQR